MGSTTSYILRPSTAILAVLLALVAAGATAAGEMAYITNADSDTVSVIDTATAEVVATIPVGARPVGVAVDRTGTRVYVTNLDSHLLSVIDTTTNAVMATIPVGINPNGVAVNAAGTRVYVANQGEDTISVIDALTFQLVDTVLVNCSLTIGVAVVPDGSSVYASCAGDPDAVVVVDGATNQIRREIALPAGSNPKGVSVSPDGSRVYVALAAGGQVAVIDTAVEGLTATVPVGAAPQIAAVHPSGDRIYVTSFGAGTLTVIDATALESMEVINTGRPLGVDVTPDGSMLLVADAGSTSTTVYVIDTATTTIVDTVTVGSRPHAFGKFIRAGSGTLDVEIDIRPGSDNNNVSAKSRGRLPVAILGSAVFNVADVDVTRVAFGPWEASPARDLTNPDFYADALEDVNQDGFIDLNIQFIIAETGLRCGDTSAALRGFTLSGAVFRDDDSVSMVGCGGNGNGPKREDRPGQGNGPDKDRGGRDKGPRPKADRGRR